MKRRVQEINGKTVWPNGTIVWRIRFNGQVPVYPQGFAWEDGVYYAHVRAGGNWLPSDIFRSEADFLQHVTDEPIGEG
jgi:predicted heme/steroid binding protein